MPDTDPRDGASRLAFDWADAHVNFIGHHVDEVAPVEGGLRCDELFRHDTHTQVLMPLDGDAVIAVAPAPIDFSESGHTEEVRAFLLHPQETVVLHRGTWHWGPYPIGRELVTLFNVQGLRYSEDNARVDLAAKGLSIEILTA